MLTTAEEHSRTQLLPCFIPGYMRHDEGQHARQPHQRDTVLSLVVEHMCTKIVKTLENLAGLTNKRGSGARRTLTKDNRRRIIKDEENGLNTQREHDIILYQFHNSLSDHKLIA